MSTTFVCLENPYEVLIFTLCWSTFQIVELASSLPSIKLPLSDHVLRSLHADKIHINPTLNKALPQSLQPYKSSSSIKTLISRTSNALALKLKATTL